MGLLRVYTKWSRSAILLKLLLKQFNCNKGKLSAITIASAGLINAEAQGDTIKEITKAVSDATADVIEDQISNYENSIKNVSSFKESLSKIAQQCKELTKTETYPSGQPLVIIIDELDRCSPIFAVKTLERIKHFFTVDNIVFVLMVNKEQLVQYIKGMYGVGVNGDGYIEKFIDLSINLSSLPPKSARYELSDICYKLQGQTGIYRCSEPCGSGLKQLFG